ncbi:MAG: hypothetical protein ACREFR_02160, partial [Limisphaerales bacterium]
IRDVQFVNDSVPLFCDEVTNYLENGLIWNASGAAIWEEDSATIAENVTADGGGKLWDDAMDPCSLDATNCLFVGLTNIDPTVGAYNYTNSSDLGIFQVVGGGSHYLAAGSPYRGVGTTNIDPALLADLAQETTWPPIVYSDTNISSLGILGPTAPRDVSSSPDLGYHYFPLDYVFGGCDLYSNLTLTAGTGVGCFQENGPANPDGQPYSISLNHGANLCFNGNATQPCYFARYALVQEGENGNWTPSGWLASLVFDGGSPSPQLSADFTKFTTDQRNRGVFRDAPGSGAAGFRNCEFYNGGISSYDLQSLDFTNCLFFRDFLSFWDQDYALSYTFENCTFYNGCLCASRSSGLAGDASSFWLIENTTFDGTALKSWDNLNGNAANTLFNYNAYNTNNLSWTSYPFPYPPDYGTNEVVGPNDLMTTNYNWQTGWLGNFYLPPATASPLYEAGSTSASVLGLYWFTTQTSAGSYEGSYAGGLPVDIGYHYIGTDEYGNPIATYGIPSYLEDANG